MSTLLVQAGSAYGLATAVLALRTGRVARADRVVLVCTNTSAVPEVTGGLRELAPALASGGDFDATVDLNEAIDPQHPTLWAPRGNDLPVWERHLRQLWDLGTDEVDLLVEGLPSDPALGLARVFGEARIDAYGSGLLTYAPSPSPTADSIGARVEQLVHVDLVPGLEPLRLRELGVPRSTLAAAEVAALLAPSDAEPSAEPVAVLVGQPFAADGDLSQAEENALYEQMVTGAVAAGHRRLELLPHPGATLGPTERLRRAASALGAELVVGRGAEPAEARFARGGIALVVGCCSASLLTARAMGLPAATTGTDLLLERLTPYENSQRIAATLVHECVPSLETFVDRRPAASELDLGALLTCVGYCMEPERNPDLRPVAEGMLGDFPDELRPFVKRRRLTALDLPGRSPKRPKVPAALRALRHGLR